MTQQIKNRPPPLFSPQKSLKNERSVNKLSQSIPPLFSMSQLRPITQQINEQKEHNIIRSQNKQKKKDKFEPEECISRLIILDNQLMQQNKTTGVSQGNSKIAQNIPLHRILKLNAQNHAIKQDNKKFWRKQFLKNTNIRAEQLQTIQPKIIQENRTKLNEINIKYQNMDNIPYNQEQKREDSMLQQNEQIQGTQLETTQIKQIIFGSYHKYFKKISQSSLLVTPQSILTMDSKNQSQSTKNRTKRKSRFNKMKQIFSSKQRMRDYLRQVMETQIQYKNKEKQYMLEQYIRCNKDQQQQQIVPNKNIETNLSILRCVIDKLIDKNIKISLMSGPQKQQQRVSLKILDKQYHEKQQREIKRKFIQKLDKKDVQLEEYKRNYDYVIANLVETIQNLSKNKDNQKNRVSASFPLDLPVFNEQSFESISSSSDTKKFNIQDQIEKYRHQSLNMKAVQIPNKRKASKQITFMGQNQADLMIKQEQVKQYGQQEMQSHSNLKLTKTDSRQV